MPKGCWPKIGWTGPCSSRQKNKQPYLYKIEDSARSQAVSNGSPSTATSFKLLQWIFSNGKNFWYYILKISSSWKNNRTNNHNEQRREHTMIYLFIHRSFNAHISYVFHEDFEPFQIQVNREPQAFKPSYHLWITSSSLSSLSALSLSLSL